MLGSDVLSSSECLIAELIGLLNRDSILTFELIGPLLPWAEWLLLADSSASLQATTDP